MRKANTFVTLVQRKLKGGTLSLRGICRASGIDPSYLSKVLQGKRSPPGDEKALTRLAKVLEVDPAFLIISTGTIPSSIQDAMERPEFIRKVFAESRAPRRKDQRPIPPSPVKRFVPQMIKSPELSEDLL